MDLLFRKLNLNESSQQSNLEILKCPFLRNINEPTNFSLASSSAAPIPACSKGGARGPIFEDGPNFNTAFRLFHGRDGVVPLSGRSSDPKPRVPHLNNLAADAASISLSSFGGPFSFNSFSDQWKKQEREREPIKILPWRRDFKFLRMWKRNDELMRVWRGPMGVRCEKPVGIDLETTNSTLAVIEGGM